MRMCEICQEGLRTERITWRMWFACWNHLAESFVNILVIPSVKLLEWFIGPFEEW